MTSRAAGVWMRRRTRKMEREAAALAVQAQRFTDCIRHGGPYSPDAERLLKQAGRVASCAARLDGMQDVSDMEEE